MHNIEWVHANFDSERVTGSVLSVKLADLEYWSSILQNEWFGMLQQ